MDHKPWSPTRLHKAVCSPFNPLHRQDPQKLKDPDTHQWPDRPGKALKTVEMGANFRRSHAQTIMGDSIINTLVISITGENNTKGTQVNGGTTPQPSRRASRGCSFAENDGPVLHCDLWFAAFTAMDKGRLDKTKTAACHSAEKVIGYKLLSLLHLYYSGTRKTAAQCL